ncbi:MAG: response regulator transcription factor [Pseudomonadales bacterium]|jgi:DNA-binding response OmpR family regulator|nr:response regulator transcription factor [Pseudomonadales bacterium]
MRILLVEDKLPLAKSLSRILSSHRYTVDRVADSEKDFDLVLANDYGTIILDLDLLHADSLEVLSKIRAKKKTTPILILAARSQTSDIVAALQEGADDYIVEPLDSEEVVTRIRVLTRHVRLHKTELIKMSDLTFDEDLGEVRRDGKLIALSKTEINLFSYLIRNTPRVISKDELLDRVWEDDGDVYDRIVDTYIYYLRQKIDKAFPKSKPLIHTIKTRGYKLAPDYLN